MPPVYVFLTKHWLWDRRVMLSHSLPSPLLLWFLTLLLLEVAVRLHITWEKKVCHWERSSFLVTYTCVCQWNLLIGCSVLYVEQGKGGEGLYSPNPSSVAHVSCTIAAHQIFGNFSEWRFLLWAQVAGPPEASGLVCHFIKVPYVCFVWSISLLCQIDVGIRI